MDKQNNNNNNKTNDNKSQDIRQYFTGWKPDENNNNDISSNYDVNNNNNTSTSINSKPKDDKPSFLRKSVSNASNKGNQLYHGKRTTAYPTSTTTTTSTSNPYNNNNNKKLSLQDQQMNGLPKNFSRFDPTNKNKFVPSSTATTTTTTTTKQNNNGYYNNRNNARYNGIGNSNSNSNFDQSFDLSKLGVTQYSSNYVETKVIQKIDKELIYNEIKELDNKLKTIVKEKEEAEQFLFKNNEREINSNNDDYDSDTLKSLLALIQMNKKKVNQLKLQEKSISNEIFKKRENLRIDREKRIENQKMKQNGNNNNNNSSGSGNNTTSPISGELPLPSLFDKAFGFATQESERDRLIRTGKITPFYDNGTSGTRTNKKTILLDSIIDINETTALQDESSRGNGIGSNASKTVQMNAKKKSETNRFDKKKKVLTPKQKKKQQKMKKYSIPREAPKKLQEFYDDLESDGDLSGGDDDDDQDYQDVQDDVDIDNDEAEEQEEIKKQSNKEKKKQTKSIPIPKTKKTTTTTTTSTSKVDDSVLNISLNGRIRTPANRLINIEDSDDDNDDANSKEDEEKQKDEIIIDDDDDDDDDDYDDDDENNEKDDDYKEEEQEEEQEEEDLNIDEFEKVNKRKSKITSKSKRKRKSKKDENETDDEDEDEEEEEEYDSNTINIHKERWTDDGNEKVYLKRLLEWKKKKISDRIKKMNQKKRLEVLEKYTNNLMQTNKQQEEDDEDELKQYGGEDDYLDNDKLDRQAVFNSNNINNEIADEEINKVFEEEEKEVEEETIGDDFEIDETFKIPYDIHKNLFEYQVTGVRWLYELHSQETGGIVGDEMGLGKTIQIVSFLASLHYSRRLGGPALVVAPATLLSNWIKEFHKWWPPFRVGLFHSSGSSSSGELDDIVKKIASKGHILLTTFDSIRIHQDILLKHHWEYVILDEGHKIRNPDAEITLSCKQLQTPHRVILSGSPIQNKLTELWSLFDFVFPGRLGTLPIFKSQFSVPISVGGFANATPIQVQTAYKCAVALRDLISPYMLRRVKSDVLKSLPSKNEQVLMCPLSQFQEQLYLEYLDSNDIKSVLDGKRNALYGIDVLKKICNHPDILHLDSNDEDRPKDYGNIERSAKLKVVETILPLWHKQGDKVLLFCQTRQMLNIVEDFVKNSTQFNYLRMDGTTSIKQRQSLVEEFNMDPELFVFLLTTKVGGLGLNLTGANRVILFDPDWNPSTDMQARERVYRIGQKKSVTIYRLITLGTIEEKIYHRQIYKQFLTNKILKDPRQKRFFKSKHFKDLFTYTKNKKGSETGDIFSGTNSEILPEHMNKKSNSKPNGGGGSGGGSGLLSNNSQIIPKKKLEESEILDDDDDDDDDDIVGKKRGRGRGGKVIVRNNNDIVQDSNNDDDSYILKCLFEKEGLKSALKHDTIMDQSGPEHSLLVNEAEKIASKAVSILKKSREHITKGLATPTWTGLYGSGGAPSIISSPTNTSTAVSNAIGIVSSGALSGIGSGGGGRFGQKSKLPTLLSQHQQTNNITTNNENTVSNINNNNNNSNNSNNSSNSNSIGSKNNNNNNNRFSSSKLLSTLNEDEEETAKQLFGGLNPSEIIEKIFNFIIEKGGSVSTQTIINNFELAITEDQAPLFKVLLKSVSEFSKVTKKWVVKPEFLLN